jgi:hypothetical protein
VTLTGSYILTKGAGMKKYRYFPLEYKQRIVQEIEAGLVHLQVVGSAADDRGAENGRKPVHSGINYLPPVEFESILAD